VIFNLCALLAGVLAGRLKDRAQAATRANFHLTSLLDVSEALQKALTLDDIPGVLARSAPGKSGLRVGLLRVRDDQLKALGNAPATMESADIAIRAMHSGDAVLHQDGLTAWRLNGSDGVVGVMLTEQAVADRFDPAFLSAFANLAALAIERANLSAMVSETHARERTEELKSALLSSVSHDFRTPLTAISASASSLIDYRDQLDPATSVRLLRGIVDECERLNRYTANLLEIGRLEAGIPRQLQILSVSEMLASAIQRVRPRAGDRRIERVLAGDDLLVTADAALFELVLVNVLGNAIVYSEDGTRVLIESEKEDSFCRITIADEGEGIPADDLHHIFDRFYRVDRAEPSPRGSGLGLAITKGFVEALGGSVEARTPGIGERGTRIIIRLPLAEGEGSP
jgi:two-component system sensor histidine kinase KdpD